ncbi:hypothetical protein SCORR_v1c04030 [Spiroplasma corruscae]|uniref:DUF3137 domain-containing protein n=1 Tax=Spiroplasma corruscae TaxID=216934 RepID=A0A222ENV5_9MOLU|nr:hypothetical protein [Spiroplasma corruscae]ASP28177.1 hypothetical protein SCORR_v1c04030 [Spiroplasma corruscae]
MKESIYNKIDFLFKKDVDFIKSIKWYSNVLLAFRFFFYFGTLCTLLGVSLLIVFLYGSESLSNYVLIIIIFISFGVIFLLTSYILKLLISKKNRKKRLVGKQFSNDKMKIIYTELFNENYTNIDITDFDLVFDFNTRVLNNLHLKYKGNKIVFYIEKPLIINKKDFLLLDSIGDGFLFGLVIVLFYWMFKPRYKCNDTTLAENKKFDKTFNGLKVTKGKKRDKNFQSESIEFNKLYDINIDKDDLRAPLFLSPKLIDKLVDFNEPEFVSLGIDDKIYYNRSRVIKGFPMDEVGIPTYERIKNYKTFRKELYKKIIEDLNLLSNSLAILFTTLD